MSKEKRGQKRYSFKGHEWPRARPRYAEHPRWLRLGAWLELANRLPDVDTINFGIRNHRMVEIEDVRSLRALVRNTLDVFVLRRPSGITSLDSDPFSLFLSVLDASDLARIKRCKV